MLTQPEIVYKINKSTVANGTPSNSNTKLIQIKHEEIKKRIKTKMLHHNNHHKTHDKQIKHLIYESSKPIEIHTILTKELDDQQNNFKRRLEEKKKKLQNLSTSRIQMETKMVQANEISSTIYLNDEISEVNYDKFVKEINQINELDDNKTKEEANDLNNPNDSACKNNDQLDNEGEGKYILTTGDKDNLDNDTSSMSFPGHESSRTKLKTPRNRQVFNDLGGNIDKFISEFNYYFYEEVFQKVVLEIEKSLNVKQEKSLEITRNYSSQIKEMEFLLNTEDNDEKYKEEFKAIINQLEEEHQMELDKLEEDTNQIIKEIKRKFRADGFKANSGIQLIEEKFRLDMYNSIMNLFSLNNK